MNTDPPDYDLTVIPFCSESHWNSYERCTRPIVIRVRIPNPVRAVEAAGGFLVAASDARVENSRSAPLCQHGLCHPPEAPRKPPLKSLPEKKKEKHHGPAATSPSEPFNHHGRAC